MSHILLSRFSTRLAGHLRPLLLHRGNNIPTLKPPTPLQVCHAGILSSLGQKFQYWLRIGAREEASKSESFARIVTIKNGYIQQTDPTTPNYHHRVTSWWCPHCQDPKTRAHRDFKTWAAASKHLVETGHRIEEHEVVVVEIVCYACVKLLGDGYVTGQKCRDLKGHRAHKMVRELRMDKRSEEVVEFQEMPWEVSKYRRQVRPE
ncbi:hypothetical protein EX30DRAFT_344045 [Ascodesmis nigricans]|uniref:Uncharacterized protein n=1 Tax=Ascodesmis nigricans TaxID=341454 RepID=A0A4S2MKQ5_9PEZI|nr:hypothetical protein EX30DRAFT_344045 [Ascodesmis nigricans]